jgi:anti-sigma factor RsiW
MADIHPEPHPDLAGYVLGGLAAAETSAFEAHLATCATCRAELAELQWIPGVLDDPAPAVELPPGLRARTLTTVAGTPRESAARPVVTDLVEGRRRREARLAGRTPLVLGIAAAVVGVVVAGALVVRSPGGGATTEFALTSTAGEVKVRKLESGWRIELDAALPRRDNGRYYQAFLEGPDGRVSIGTFNEGNDVVLWSGVPPTLYQTFLIVEQPGDRVVARTRVVK